MLCQSLLLLVTQMTALKPLPQLPLHLLKEVDMLFKKCDCFHSFQFLFLSPKSGPEYFLQEAESSFEAS